MEYWDIYTQDGICTGRRVKRGDAMAIGDYHLVIHLLILGKVMINPLVGPGSVL